MDGSGLEPELRRMVTPEAEPGLRAGDTSERPALPPLTRLDPGGMQSLWFRPGNAPATWLLRQAGEPVAALVRAPHGTWIETRDGRWALLVRVSRRGWWANFTPIEGWGQSLEYLPYYVRPGGRLVAGQSYCTLRIPVLGATWRLAAADRGELMRIRNFRGREERMEIALQPHAASEPLLALLTVAGCWAIAREWLFPVGGGA